MESLAAQLGGFLGSSNLTLARQFDCEVLPVLSPLALGYRGPRWASRSLLYAVSAVRPSDSRMGHTLCTRRNTNRLLRQRVGSGLPGDSPTFCLLGGLRKLSSTARCPIQGFTIPPTLARRSGVVRNAQADPAHRLGLALLAVLLTVFKLWHYLEMPLLVDAVNAHTLRSR